MRPGFHFRNLLGHRGFDLDLADQCLRLHGRALELGGGMKRSTRLATSLRAMQGPLCELILMRGLIAAFFGVVFAALLLPGCTVDEKSATQKPVDAVSGPVRIPASVDLPILVYHHVRPGSTSALFVSPEEFDKQLKYLQDNGFHTISFDDLADSLEKGKPLPLRPAIISFDDGWENQFEYGFPILQKYHDTATFFVVTNHLDQGNFMTTDQLKTLVAAGMTVGCHTLSHPNLTSLGQDRARDEIAGAKAILEADGFKIDTFAYPYGAYNKRVVDMVANAGFRSARTVGGGVRVTADKLGTLPGMTFQTFTDSYASQETLTSGEALR
jgi:peptidoglycan/xylan/chitin deacetylase (PgdA/CDA1 family)